MPLDPFRAAFVAAIAAASVAFAGCGDDSANPSNPDAGPVKDAASDTTSTPDGAGEGGVAVDAAGADAPGAGAEPAGPAGPAGP
jgi:hypothetical protein